MRTWLILATVLTAALAGVFARRDASTEPLMAPGSALPPPSPVTRVAPRGREAFAGSTACASCHRAQSDAYRDSHHARALAAPARRPQLESGRHTSRLGGTTRFTLRDGAPVVVAPGSAGRVETFPIAYVSGVWPLEQYVIATERGKLQSLPIIWDTRAASEGGNRWLHVYGKDGIAPSDPLSFTAPAQNFNHMCADCHSTLVERRYDPETDSFDTRWAELSVGCEACHGPGAEHVRSAREGKPKPFAVSLKLAEPWMPSRTGSPEPRVQSGVEVEVCAPCHSRREPIKEGFIAGDRLLDHFEPELLLPGRYHADGQVEGEVYEWGSFVQSRMYHAGVSCSDCHNVHSGKPYASGNALCVRCHEPGRFDVAAHSHHSGPRAPLCIDCHMPPATFMQIDERRDHSIRIPRPDHSVNFGAPNACNLCHTRESAAWARDAVAKWFPKINERRHFVEALKSERSGALEAPRALRALADDPSFPAIARATALDRLGRYPAKKTVDTLRRGLASSDRLVAYGAALGAAELPPRLRARLLAGVLNHRLRALRILAAKALAGVPSTELDGEARAALERAFVEVEQSFDVSASRAETHVERSAYELSRGKLEAARDSLGTALRLSPCLAEAYLNLADLERQRGDEPAAERAIRAALECNPKSAAAHHALGLFYVRMRRTDTALSSLEKAAALEPADRRFRYVLAVALAGKGRRDEAIRILEGILKDRPNDAAALEALAGYLGAAGKNAAADEVRRRLDTLLRD